MEKEHQQQIHINMDPNMYTVSNVNVAFDEENVYLNIFSGNQGRQFAVSPKHAKRLMMLLQNHMAEYEKKFGELKTKLPEAPKNTQENNHKKVGF